MPFAALRHRDFRYLWLGLLASNTGTWMQMVAQGWLIYELTDSPLYLGLVGLARGGPIIIFSLFGGTLADRVDRRKLLYFTNLLATAFALLLAILTWTGRVEVWHVLLLAFLSASVLAFDQPTRQALVPTLVPREALFNAVALNSMTFNGAAIFGPALAGMLVPIIGVAGNFLINALSYGFVLLALWRMNIPAFIAPPRTKLLDDLIEGFRYLRSQPLLLGLLGMTVAVSFFGRSYIGLMPVFARDVVDAGVEGLGVMMSAPGLGTVIGAFTLASLGSFRRKGALVIVSGISLGVILVAFAYSRSFYTSTMLLVLVGGLAILTSSTINTLLQLTVEDRLRGRVMSMYTLSMLGMHPLGQLPLGALAEVAGAPLAVSLGALAMGAAILIALWAVPQIRRLE